LEEAVEEAAGYVDDLEEAGASSAASKRPGKKMLYGQALERARASEAAARFDAAVLSSELTRARRELRKLHAVHAENEQHRGPQGWRMPGRLSAANVAPLATVWDNSGGLLLGLGLKVGFACGHLKRSVY
jgi:hypothetical protein